MARKRILIATPESLPALFAQSRYASLLGAAGTLPLSGKRLEIRARLRAGCPALPGVYGMISPAGQLIYAGMSGCLQRRLLSYFSSRVSPSKERRIAHRSTTVVWQPAAHELIARLRERELIRQYRPNYNVQGHPTQMKLGYLVLLDQAAPAFAVQSRIPRKHSGVWGPLPLTQFLRQAVQELNHHFQLRDCPRETPIRFKNDVSDPAAESFTPCMRADLKTCLAPCIAACSRTAYQKQVQAASRFLNGAGEEALDELASAMQLAVVERKYERAAMLRDRRQALERIDLHLRRFHDWTSQANFLYPITSSLDGCEWWLVVIRGAVQLVLPRPQTPPEKVSTQGRLVALESRFAGKPDQAVVTGPDEFECARLLFRWFRRLPEEKSRQFSLAKARRLCQSKHDPRRPAND